MKTIIITLLLFTIAYIYTLYIQIIKIKKRKNIILINFILLFSTIFLEQKILDTREFNIKIITIYLTISIIYFFILYLTKDDKKNSITNKSIKEAIDLSSSGILVLKNKNKIKIQNLVMQEILNNLNIHNNYIENLKSIGKITSAGEYVILSNENAWLFVINEKDLEIIAINISEEYKLNHIVERQNKEIEENNKKIIWTIENMEYIEKEKESQELKNKFHDLLGQSFSMLQQYLNQKDLENKKVEDIKSMIKETFNNIEDKEEPEVNLEYLIEAHKNTGTEVKIVGTLPKDRKIAKVFFEIIREAVTNAIRHAESKHITVEIENEIDRIEMIITNDGKLPKEMIIEHQGIKGMRRKIESLKGRLFITTNPEFKITVII